MQIKASITTIACALVAVAIVTGAWSNRAAWEYKQPQETNSCSFDNDDTYDGITYQNIRLGISFAELKRLLDKSHHALLPNKRNEESCEWIYDSADDWPISGIGNWRPSFCFVEDQGAYRLWEIRGKVPSDFETMKRIRASFTAKYGRAVSNTPNSSSWVSGSAHQTFASLTLATQELSFSDIDLLRIGVQNKYNSPNLIFERILRTAIEVVAKFIR